MPNRPRIRNIDVARREGRVSSARARRDGNPCRLSIQRPGAWHWCSPMRVVALTQYEAQRRCRSTFYFAVQFRLESRHKSLEPAIAFPQAVAALPRIV